MKTEQVAAAAHANRLQLLGGNTKIIRDQQKTPLTVDVRTGAKLPRNLSLSRLDQKNP